MSRRFTVRYEELADTTASNARGSSAGTTYMLEPRMWLKELVDGAKKDHLYAQFCNQFDVPKGTKDAIVPKRKAYLDDWESSVTPGTSVNYTTMNNMDGVTVTPSYQNYAIAITYDTIRTNAVNYVAEAQEELRYKCGDVVDQAVVTALLSATAADSDDAGYQTVYGGDATRASELSAGDTIDTDIISEAKRKIQSSECKYWTLGTGEYVSSAAKNPWKPPYALLISPYQEDTLRRDSQFTSAAEYGSDKVIHSGQIAEYLGVDIVVSNNTKSYNSGSTTRDGTAAGADMSACVMLKPKHAAALGWGTRPTLHIVDYPRELEQDLIIEMSYAASVVQDDAIVFIDVSKE